MQHRETLKLLGLTEYESRVFESLVLLGPSRVKEIVHHSKVPRNKVYEVLPRLAKRNLIAMLPVSPTQYKVADLSMLDSLIEERKRSLQTLEKGLEALKHDMTHQDKEYREFFWVIKSQRAIQEKLRVENEKARKEILSVHSLSQHLPANLRSIRVAVQSGVVVRFICILNEKNMENVLRWQEAGADIRIYNAERFGMPMPRFSIFDKNSVRLTIGNPEIKDPDEYLSLWTESPALAQLFRNYFLTLWESSIPLKKALRQGPAARQSRRG
jgi:sugar-specific transcriptional regulator TrmB